MPDVIELNPVDFITIGTIGPPGQRVFHLQAGQGDQLLTLIIEKEQASALAGGISALLQEIEDQFELKTSEVDDPTIDLDLREPILPAFRVAQMGLGYDSEQDRLVLIASELLLEDDSSDPRTARMTVSRVHMNALSEHTRKVVAGGRPICGNCGRPIDADGHFCPGSNGHRKRITG